MSIAYSIYDFGTYKPFAYKTSAPANIPQNSTAFLRGNPWVRALYPAKACFNTRIVKLHSHVKECRGLRDTVDDRERAMLRKADSVKLFRVRGN